MRRLMAMRSLAFLAYWTILAVGFMGCNGGGGNGDGGNGDDGTNGGTDQPPAASDTKIYGKVFSAANDSPLSGATITVAKVAGQLKTDSQGRFAFPVPGAGTYAITAKLAGYTYAQRQATVVKGELSCVAEMYLTPEDTAVITMDQNGGTGSNSDGSIALDVPAAALNTAVQMRATAFKRGKDLPNFLPTPSHFTYACELTPNGQTFSQPVTVRTQNTRGFAPGTQIPVGVYDDKTLQWTHESMGVVSNDGKWVEFKVTHFSPRDINLGRTSPTGSGEPGSAQDISDGIGSKTITKKNNQPCSTVGGGSQIGVADGHLSVDHVLPSYQNLGQRRTIALQYNSNVLSSSQVLGLSYDISKTSVPLPERIRFIVEVGGQRIERFFKPIDGPMVFHYRWDGKDGMGATLPSGDYTYKLTLVNEYTATFATVSTFGGTAVTDTSVQADEYVGFPSTFTGTFKLGESVSSDVGPGWGIVGVHRLRKSGSTINIVGGDGTSYTFTADSQGQYTSASGDFSQLASGSGNTYAWTRPDLTQISFDANGQQTDVTDRNGNSTTFTYNSQGRLTTVTDPMSKATTFTYDSNGRLASIADPVGRTNQFQVNSSGDLAKITHPDATSRQFAYDSQHQMTSQTDAGGYVTSYTYSTSGSVTRVDRADGSYTQYSAGTAMGLINDFPSGTGTETNPFSFSTGTQPSYTDGAGGTYTYQVNGYGTRTLITDPLGRKTTMDRNDDDRIVLIAFPSGKTIGYNYDSRGNVVMVRTDRDITITYDSVLNLPVSVADAAIGTWTYTYDSKGNLTKAQLASGKTYTMTYNQYGQVTSVSAGGLTSSATYDSNGNPATLTDPAGDVWTFSYDNYGNVSGIADPAGRSTAATYNTMNLVTQMVNGAGDTVKFTYAPAKGSVDLDGLGQVAVITQITDGRGGTSTFGYDKMYRLTSLADASNNTTTLGYDGAGRLTSRTEANGGTVALTYNAAGEQISKTLNNSETITYTLGSTTGLLTAATTTKSNLAFSYDTHGRLSKAVTTFLPSNFDATLDYEYRTFGSYQAMTHLTVGGNSSSFGYEYDATHGELPVAHFGGGYFWLYPSYDSADRQAGWQESYSGTTAAFTYDAASRLTGTTYKDSLDTTRFSASWAYGSGGLITQMTDPDGTHSYTYDSAARLTQAIHPQAGNPTENYSYDKAGNRRTTGQESSFVYDAGNRLTDDPTYHYDYDASGNLIKKTNKVSSAVTQYTYDAANRLTGISLPTGTSISLAYDALGRLVERQAGTFIMRFVYDGDEMLAVFDGSNQMIRSYVNGSDIDRPEGVKVGDLTTYTNYYFYTDPVGTILATASDDGQVAMANRLQAFGKPISPAATERLFAGLLYDSQAELYYVRNRFYDPNTGRFLQRDRVPARWAIEPYVYAGNNPVNNRDPFGLSPEGGESWRTDEMVWDNVTKPSLFAAGSEALGRLPEVGESLALESAKRIEGYRGAGRVAAGAVLMAGEKGAAAVDFVAQTHEVLWILFSKCTTKAAVDWYKEQWWNPASKYVDQFMSVGGLGSRR